MKIFLIFVLTLFLYADSDDYRSKMHLPKDLGFLHLNKNQKSILKVVLKEHRYKLKKLHQEEEKLEEFLQESFKSGVFDKKKYIQKSMKIKQSIVEIEADFFEKIYSLLDEKQRERFIEYIEEWEVE